MNGKDLKGFEDNFLIKLLIVFYEFEDWERTVLTAELLSAGKRDSVFAKLSEELSEPFKSFLATFIAEPTNQEREVEKEIRNIFDHQTSCEHPLIVLSNNLKREITILELEVAIRICAEKKWFDSIAELARLLPQRKKLQCKTIFD